MTNTITHEKQDFQYSGKTGLYLPTQLRKQVDPTLTEKAWNSARRPIVYGLTALTLAGTVAPTIKAGDSITIENTLKGEQNNDFDFERTRTKVNLGSATITYDQNMGENPDEAKIWVNGLSKNGWYIGILAQGQTDNGKNSFADIGACVSKTIEDKTYETFIGPTVQPGLKPCIFYQFAVRDTSGKENFLLSLVDDKEIPFSLDHLDFRGYATAQFGNTFGGLGIRQKGQDVTRIYGGFGFNNKDVGTMTIFRYFPIDRKGKFKMQNAFGDAKDALGLATINLWNDMEGPGMRDMSVPYFTSFLTKGKLTSVIEGNFSPGTQDIETMVGNNFGPISLGAGVNYHHENGKTEYGGLIHLARSIDLGPAGTLYVEGKGNTRNDLIQLFTKIQKGF